MKRTRKTAAENTTPVMLGPNAYTGDILIFLNLQLEVPFLDELLHHKNIYYFRYCYKNDTHHIIKQNIKKTLFKEEYATITEA